MPREITRWALRKAGVEEWLVLSIMAMYDGALTVVRTLDGDSDRFEVKVGLASHSCGTCCKGVWDNSIRCSSCSKWGTDDATEWKASCKQLLWPICLLPKYATDRYHHFRNSNTFIFVCKICGNWTPAPSCQLWDRWTWNIPRCSILFILHHSVKLSRHLIHPHLNFPFHD